MRLSNMNSISNVTPFKFIVETTVNNMKLRHSPFELTSDEVAQSSWRNASDIRRFRSRKAGEYGLALIYICRWR